MGNLWGYLAIRPGDLTFTELDLDTLESRENFVGGSLERIELAENIEIWVNDESHTEVSLENLTLDIQNGATRRLVFGKIFLATTDQLGHCVPMSYQQAYWLRAHLLTGVKSDNKFYKIIDLKAAPKANVGLRE